MKRFHSAPDLHEQLLKITPFIKNIIKIMPFNLNFNLRKSCKKHYCLTNNNTVYTVCKN